MAAEEHPRKRLEEINRKEKLQGTVVKTLLAGAIIDVGLEVTWPCICAIRAIK